MCHQSQNRLDKYVINCYAETWRYNQEEELRYHVKICDVTLLAPSWHLEDNGPNMFLKCPFGKKVILPDNYYNRIMTKKIGCLTIIILLSTFFEKIFRLYNLEGI